MKKQPTLYDCANARIGEPLHAFAEGADVHAIVCDRYGKMPRSMHTLAIKDAKPLRAVVCDGCPHFESNGEPLPKELKGWA